jgi:signal transduction histidine kinase
VQGSRAKGWGLGLALSEHIVRSLGGEITFNNVYADDVAANTKCVAEGFLAQVMLPLYRENDS